MTDTCWVLTLRRGLRREVISVIESRPDDAPGVVAIPSSSDTREVSTLAMLERPSVSADPLIAVGLEGTAPVLEEPVVVLEEPVAPSAEKKCSWIQSSRVTFART